MAEVTVTIAGRNYRMACDDGQESHLQRLGDLVDQKINDMRASFGEIGDMRLTVMAAIVIADELAESRSRLSGVEEKLSRLQSGDKELIAASEHETAEAVELIEHLAERLEILGADLRSRLRTQAGVNGA
ncbi:cell division protein ZapA [Terrihabitans soli]|uniref:Cell division protein ZapA n=1 Tax=Terrihabitans soli TaxID=708113 RepID=A0A6S6QLT8_9HYPH|nr:cell division protein ZapA [Terrihabitans soli]BCJ89869.1 cell division protein ZapA [Terrihabitans soli]